MFLGYVSIAGRGECDALLADVVARLEAAGWPLAGTVQTNIDKQDSHHCDMDLRVLPDGPTFRISQDLGAGSKGCRLNPGALEQSVAEVEPRMAGARLLVINKFGKHEAEGRGFRPLIGEALAMGLPVILGVNGLNLPLFLDFAEGMAEALPADAEAICARLGALAEAA